MKLKLVTTLLVAGIGIAMCFLPAKAQNCIEMCAGGPDSCFGCHFRVWSSCDWCVFPPQQASVATAATEDAKRACQQTRGLKPEAVGKKCTRDAKFSPVHKKEEAPKKG